MSPEIIKLLAQGLEETAFMVFVSTCIAAVIGVPHPELGEEVKAVVQVEPGFELTAPEVREWVAEALAAFKVPAYVELRTDRLPRNASGKLLKNVLRGEGEVPFAETM